MGRARSGNRASSGRSDRSIEEVAMALSARDRRIISAIEQQLVDRDPAWAKRFGRRLRRFERRESAERHPALRVVGLTALGIGWFILLCVCSAHGFTRPWAALAVVGTGAAVGTVQAVVRRRRGGRGV
jgi:hypothetical protein